MVFSATVLQNASHLLEVHGETETMHKQLHRLAMLTALAIGASALSVTPALAIPTVQDQDHHDQSQNQKERTARFPNTPTTSTTSLGNKGRLRGSQEEPPTPHPQSQLQER